MRIVIGILAVAFMFGCSDNETAEQVPVVSDCQLYYNQMSAIAYPDAYRAMQQNKLDYWSIKFNQRQWVAYSYSVSPQGGIYIPSRIYGNIEHDGRLEELRQRCAQEMNS